MTLPNELANGQITDDQIKEVVTKKKRNRPDLANYGQEYVEPGDNAKYVTFAMETFNLGKVDLNDSDQVIDRINGYFRRCIENDMKPGVVGLANSLGISRQELWNIKSGERGKRLSIETVDAIKKAYGFLEELWEDYMMNGKISPPNGIFIGKNHFSYVDQQNIVVAPQSPLDSLDSDQARKRLTEGIPDDD